MSESDLWQAGDAELEDSDTDTVVEEVIGKCKATSLRENTKSGKWVLHWSW